jgi:hypothetical protein
MINTGTYASAADVKVAVEEWVSWRDTELRAGEIGWFVVTVDDQTIHLSVTPPGRPPWQAILPWNSITRVCFEAEGPLASDSLYLYTSLRAESWVVPVEAVGETSLFQELISRRLFDPALAISAMYADQGLFCWPDEDPATDASCQAH